MMRIACIGDSHAGAFKRGWNLVPELWRSAQISYFVTWWRDGKETLLSLRADGTRLVSDDEQVRENFYRGSGSQAIETEKFDAFLLVGCQLQIAHTLHHLHYVKSHDYAKLMRPNVVSRSFLRACMKEYLSTRSGIKLSNMLKAIQPKKTVVVVPSPMRATCVLAETDQWSILRELEQAGLSGQAAGDFHDTICALIPSDVVVFNQLASTLQSPILTDDKFLDPSAKKSPNDYGHVTAEYGAAHWREIVQKVLTDATAGALG